MRKKQFLAIALVVLIALMSVTAFAVPLLINFQGKLTDDTGAPLDGNYDMTFHIYNQVTGGTSLWNETQTVAVSEGIYNVRLGEVSALSGTVFDGDSLYLEVIVETETLSPRQRITSVAYAMKAQVAEGVKAGAITSSMLASGAVTSSAMQDGSVLTEILDDDGPGSQLNCDFIDGSDSSAFATAGHLHDSRYYTKAEVDLLQNRIAALEALLINVTRVGNDLTFSGMNVKIVDGSGTTDGTVNGLGNLIVGYNELRGMGDNRTGSHNIVVGSQQNYSSYGGLVAGSNNTISGIYSSVSGGYNNTANGRNSSVSGGAVNTSSGLETSVSGGIYNTASGQEASVSGGINNTASGSWSSVSGGNYNTAGGLYASVSGGYYNLASGDYSFVGGGGYTGGASNGNKAFGHYSAILGGRANVAGDSALTDHTIGQSSCVSGGTENTASGDISSVSGGAYNQASGNYSFVGGGGYTGGASDGNKAFGHYSAILGGYDNIAGDSALNDHTIGQSSSVSGGYDNDASGLAASVSGGYTNAASNTAASVTGGRWSTASGIAASVTGGRNNQASGASSSVSGGNARTAAGADDWAAGLLWQDN